MSILQFAILGAVATSDPNITITRRADGFVATIKPFAVAEQGAVDAEVDRRAGELCAGKSVKWGSFGSVVGIDRRSDKAPEITNYFKEFTCISLQPRAHAAVSADWKPSLADESDVRRFFDLYYAKRDSGDFSAAAAMFDPAQGIVLGSDEQRQFNAQLGVGSRQVIRVTWYVNPDGADRPGVFAALDFVGSFKSMHFYCGYLVLYRVGEGSYEIVREEQNQFARGHDEPDPAELASMRSTLCRD